MYGNKLAIAIKHNGKVLREHKDTVYLPFGQEFTILIKNLNSVRASVRVTIDGQDVLNGTSLVVQPNSETELKRYLNGTSTTQGNAFKFIERTASIEECRGVKIDDGIVRIEYQFEERVDQPKLTQPITTWPSDYDRRFGGLPTPTFTLTDRTLRSSYDSGLIAHAASISDSKLYNVVSEAGITVPGQVIEQAFQPVGWFPKEQAIHALVIRLLGESPQGNKVEQPITVKHKPKCVTCGHLNRHAAKFCTECGTSLTVL